MILLDASTVCPDEHIQNVKDRKSMIDAGWVLDVIENVGQYVTDFSGIFNQERPLEPGLQQSCYFHQTFFGFKEGHRIGRVSVEFKGFGTATLSFGSCFCGNAQTCSVNAYLNTKLISSAKSPFGGPCTISPIDPWPCPVPVQQATVSVEVTFDYQPGDRLVIEEVGIAVIVIHSLTLECMGK